MTKEGRVTMNKEDNDKEIVNKLLENAELASEGTDIASKLHDAEMPRLLLHKNKIVGMKTIPGLEVNAKETKKGVRAEVRIKRGFKIDKPIYLCFGVLEDSFEQNIDMHFVAEENSNSKVYAFCTFPKGKKVSHIMKGLFELKKGAKFQYQEFHYHGKDGAFVDTKIKVLAGEQSSFVTSFNLLYGAVGTLNYILNGYLDDKAKLISVAKVKSKNTDVVLVDENAELKGSESVTVLKSRLIASENSKAKFVGKVVGIGDNSRGHVDCKEILIDNGIAETIPQLKVINKKARLTHEAAIGSVDKKELQTLEARGLTREEAIDLIVKGMLD